MDKADLLGLRAELDEFLGEFRGCFVTDETAGHLGVYVRGQLGPLARKSVEPMALDGGVPPRTLQEFLSLHVWDEGLMGRGAREIVARDHGDPGAILIVDDTGVAKKGKKTAGVQRQYCGSTGKVDNCVVAVHLGYVAKDFHALVDGDLYLPRESWLDNPERCAAAGIPPEMKFRTKPEIALDLIDRTLADGVPARWLTSDEGYGESPAFLNGVAARKLLYVVEIPRSVRGWTPAGRACGRAHRRVELLWDRGGPSWVTYRVKETAEGPLVWNARATRFFPSWDPKQELWLVIAENVLTHEKKYFLSNAPATTPVPELLTVAFSRWHVERLFQDGKQEVGLAHFETRKYRAIQRHLAVSMLSLLFLNRARSARGALEPIAIALTPPAGDRGAARTRAIEPREGATHPARASDHRLSPALRRAGEGLAREGTAPGTTRRGRRSAAGEKVSEMDVAL